MAGRFQDEPEWKLHAVISIPRRPGPSFRIDNSHGKCVSLWKSSISDWNHPAPMISASSSFPMSFQEIGEHPLLPSYAAPSHRTAFRLASVRDAADDVQRQVPSTSTAREDMKHGKRFFHPWRICRSIFARPRPSLPVSENLFRTRLGKKKLSQVRRGFSSRRLPRSFFKGLVDVQDDHYPARVNRMASRN